MGSEKYVLGLDVGTTTVRAIVYDARGQIRGQARDEVKLVEVAEEGKAEIEPDQLWASVQNVLRGAIKGKHPRQWLTEDGNKLQVTRTELGNV